MCRLPNLQQIFLSDTATDTSLKLLGDAKNLKYVHLGYHPKVTSTGTAKRKARLGCDVPLEHTSLRSEP